MSYLEQQARAHDRRVAWKILAGAALAFGIVTAAVTARGAVFDPVYRVVVPVASDLGTGRLVGVEVFQSEEACLDYVKDPQFAEMLKDIVAYHAVRHVRLTGAPRCDKFDPPGAVPS